MPAELKPLFRPEALRPKLAHFTLPPAAVQARPKLSHWTTLLASDRAGGMKETELLPQFIADVFLDLLGHSGPATGAATYSLKREATIEVDGKYADAALGRFSAAGDPPTFVAAMEGKGPRDPLDRPFGGRKLSAIDQALRYAVNLPCDWYLVTNLREVRLYHKGHDQFTCERFETSALAHMDAAFRKFVFLLGADRLAPADGRTHLDGLLDDSHAIGLRLTRDYYREYADLRRTTFDRLRQHNPDVPPDRLLSATQLILDRVLFIAFCEDRELLPAESIADAYRHADPYNPRPIWENFKGLFRAVNEGGPHLNIERYNGGLFASDDLLERLVVPDVVCQGLNRLAAYEYRPPDLTDDAEPATVPKFVDVEILGHIFEQSISDLEELHQQIAAGELPAERAGPSKRKKEGAFYTPPFITRYIVQATLQPVLGERFESHRRRFQESAPKTLRKLFDDPTALDPSTLKPAQRQALVKFWNGWHVDLRTVRIVDPACGSGAFLIEAFEQLSAEYVRAVARIRDLGEAELFDLDREILESNLFGVDLNEEAIEICRLSLWIKTAQLGKVLTSLDRNVLVGNSIVADPAVHPRALDWRAAFPEVFAAGGFDVVISNPPYVRQEWISEYKPYLQANYRAYDGVADLYVYFYELGLNLLRPGGRLGFVVTNKWMKAGYGEPLRRLFGEAAWVDSVVDFGHAKKIFPDADVFPSILTLCKPADELAPTTARVCAIPREQLRVDDLTRQIDAEGFTVPRDRLRADPWSLEPPGVTSLMEKIRRVGTPLKEFIHSSPYRGILTGFNDAFLLDATTKERLLAADPTSAGLLKPYLRGQDIDRWQAEWTGLWMLALKSSANHSWPWAKAGEQAETVFQKTYPAVHAHLNQFRTALIKRQDQGENWWELRSCAYWDAFDRPKVMYQEIQFHPSYMLDRAQMLANNKVFFQPTDDLYLIGVLNSPLMWWHNWRYLPHMKDEALTPVSFLLENLPIAQPENAVRAAVEPAVSRLIAITGEQQAGRRAVLDWLRSEYGVERPSQKLQDVAALDLDTLTAEVKKARGAKKSLSVAQVKALKDEHARNIAPLQTLAAEARQLERQVSSRVNEAYRLTPDEVGLLWQTAPPRMPGDAPPQ